MAEQVAAKEGDPGERGGRCPRGLQSPKAPSGTAAMGPHLPGVETGCLPSFGKCQGHSAGRTAGGRGVSVPEWLPHLRSRSLEAGTQLTQGLLLAPPQRLVVSWGFSVGDAPPTPCFHLQLASPDRPVCLQVSPFGKDISHPEL